MSAPNHFDQAARFAARLEPADFLAWALGVAPDAFAFEGWLDTQTVPFPGEPERRCDTVARLSRRDQLRPPWLVVAEFQLEPDPDMALRLFEYAARLARELRPFPERPRDRFEAGGVVLNLTGRGNSIRTMDWPAAKMHWNLGFPERNLKDESADALLDAVAARRHSAALLPWAALMRGGDATTTIQEWKRLASAVPDGRRRSELGGLALILSEAAGRRPAWEDAMEGWEMRESVVVNRWIEEGRQEGRREGLREGEAAARQATLLELAEARFGPLPPAIVTRVRAEKDNECLRRWLLAFVNAPSLAELTAALDA